MVSITNLSLTKKFHGPGNVQHRQHSVGQDEGVGLFFARKTKEFTKKLNLHWNVITFIIRYNRDGVTFVAKERPLLVRRETFEFTSKA